MKTGKYSFKRRIIALHFFVKNTQVSLYPFLRNRGGRVGGTVRTTACNGVSRNSSPLVGSYFCNIQLPVDNLSPAEQCMSCMMVC